MNVCHVTVVWTKFCDLATDFVDVLGASSLSLCSFSHAPADSVGAAATLVHETWQNTITKHLNDSLFVAYFYKK